MSSSPAVWENWAGTESCRPEAVLRAQSVEHVSEIVADATRRGVTVRPVGSGHSFAPLVPTDGIVLDISALSGITSIDPALHQATIGAGTTIAALGEPLWDAGLTLRNQGAIDAQTIAGAMSTSTHGSGLALPMLSAGIVGADVVLASGEVERFEANDPRLPALRAAVGTLGVIVSLDLQLEPIFKIAERLEFWPFAEVLERWEEETRAHRHFSFVRGPMYDMSAVLPPVPEGTDDPTLVRIYDAVDLDAVDSDGPGQRINRPYRIYPDQYEPAWEEIEPYIPFERSREAFAVSLELLEKFPDVFPLEVRTIAGDDAWLSPTQGQESITVNLCRTWGPDNRPFFHAADEALAPFPARPHWGKQPYLRDREFFRTLYPRWDDFVRLRRRLDPTGTFLNAPLRPLLE
ncbi:FAD-binding protein [Kineococcus aurantiacus]|uniref:FAD/FMN-containing dehydrogenase n=1 Tax=Kineococcus aurantiacus TaxID=37633 RepID=A0A7Y9DQV4_9ACTN|nr:FAD-binding protein [Kineococcus aurantiacus]NYD25140.1 FAD/FMN-containing dehydrogenase [Kineococcus aurantiacus]